MTIICVMSGLHSLLHLKCRVTKMSLTFITECHFILGEAWIGGHFFRIGLYFILLPSLSLSTFLPQWFSGIYTYRKFTYTILVGEWIPTACILSARWTTIAFLLMERKITRSTTPPSKGSRAITLVFDRKISLG